jgi:tripartite-type tricarboxylate transporter receptor subunit TctC
MTIRKCLFILGCTAFAVCAASMSAAAQPFPDHVIKFVVAFPPSGGTDTLARYVGRELAKSLNENVVIENRPGASTSIASAYVSHAAADGYTVLVGSINMATNPYLYKKLPYDVNSLIPLVGLGYAPSVVVTSVKKDFHDVRDLIRYSQKNPGKLNYASYGIGSGPHLGTELLKQLSSLDATHVPYQGGGPALTSVLAGQTDFLMSSVLPVLSLIKNGQLRALGVAADKRLAIFPDVPTLKEQGIDETTGTWFGFFLNAKTPPDVVDQLERSINKIMEAKATQDFIAREGADPMLGGRPAFTRFVLSENQRWKRVVEAGKISAD